MQLSIIIPTYNEEDWIGRLVRYLKIYGGAAIGEILVSDGGSTDATAENASKAGAQVLQSPEKGRAAQMNYAASKAAFSTFYFVHADIIPPSCFAEEIQEALKEGYAVGRFTMWFKSRRLGLIVNSWFSNLDLLWCSGGDQTMFITKKLWLKMQGFNPRFVIMEEYDFMRRVRAQVPFKVIRKSVLTTDRKYKNNGYFKVNVANLKAFLMWRRGRDPQKIKDYYYQKLSS